MYHPILYLTSEHNNRDWDVRLMMADYAVQAGFAVVVGQQWAVMQNLHMLPKGLILVKTMNSIQGKAMQHAKQFGHLVAAMDEEAMPLAVDREIVLAYLAKYYSAPAIDSCDIFLANSPMHAAAVTSRIPGLRQKVRVTGNARVDILTPTKRVRYAAEADKLRAEIGPYVLFNSNIASRNSIWTVEQFLQIQVKAGMLDPNDPASVALMQEQMAFEDKNAEIFEAMMRWCAAHLPSHKIILRPHPSEAQDYWTKFEAENPNVKVVWNTRHIPWMMAADLVVHTNCTTGIEAAILDRPTLNLMPMPDSYWSKIYFANTVCPTFADAAEAQAAVAELLNSGRGPLVPSQARRDELLRYYPCIAETRSAQNMVAAMAAILEANGARNNAVPGNDAFGEAYRRFKHEGTLKKKFSKTFKEAVDDFQHVRLATGLTHSLHFGAVDDSLFLMRPAA